MSTLGNETDVSAAATTSRSQIVCRRTAASCLAVAVPVNVLDSEPRIEGVGVVEEVALIDPVTSDLRVVLALGVQVSRRARRQAAKPAA
jgi:hypothetical protein